MSTIMNISAAICVLSLLHTIIALLSPERFRRQLGIVMSIISALVIGSMVLGADISFDDIELPDTGTFEQSYEKANELVVQELEDRLSEFVSKLMNERGIPAEKISVKTTIDESGSISISEVSMTVNGSKEVNGEKITDIIKNEIGKVKLTLEYSEEENGD